MTKLNRKLEALNQYGKPRCQDTVYHPSVHHYSGFGIGKDYYTQCENSAKHDNNTRCHVHSKAHLDKRLLERIAKQPVFDGVISDPGGFFKREAKERGLRVPNLTHAGPK